jgi:hypothetical protein
LHRRQHHLRKEHPVKIKTRIKCGGIGTSPSGPEGGG